MHNLVMNVEDPNGYINELIKMYSEESLSVAAATIEEAEERLIDCE